MSGSVVLELQREALDSNSDILALLRKAHLVARKLGLKEFQEWVDSELNGYKDYQKIPEYRNLYGRLKAWNPYHGWVAVVVPDGELEKVFSHRKISDAIPSLTSLLASGNNSYAIPVPAEGCALLSRLTDFTTNYTLQLSPNSISNIIEQVKNKILDWAILLEENNILGEGLGFTREEKNKAQSEPQIINYISNFYGEVTNAQIQQGASQSSQER